MRKNVSNAFLPICLSLVVAAVAALSSSPASAGWGSGKGKKDQADQERTTDKPRTTDFKARVSPAEEAKVHIDLGRAFEAQENYDAALSEYANAIEVCKRKHVRKDGPAADRNLEALAQRRMGGALDRMGDFRQSELHYREALKASPNDAKVWNDSGYSYHMQNRWPDAERCLKMAVKIDGQTPRYQINLGLTLAAAGKTDESLKVLTKVAGPAAAHANLAYVLAGRGQTDEARRHYEQALRLEPDFQIAAAALRRLDRDARAQQPPPVVTAQAKPTAKPTGDAQIGRASTATGSPSSKQSSRPAKPTTVR